MRALVLEEFGGPLLMRELPTPEIGPYEALVRVRNVGVCGTDLKIRAGRMSLDVVPLIMGHEVAGEVAEVGSEVRGFSPGDRVTIAFYVTCGRARYCREGRDTLAPTFASTVSASSAGWPVTLRRRASTCARCPATCPWNRPVSWPTPWLRPTTP